MSRRTRRAMIAPVLAALISVLAPPLCIACAADAGRAAPLCSACRAELATGAGRTTPAGWWTAFAYDGPAGAMVRALKFGGRISIADVMAAQIAAHAPPALLTGALVPVPVHAAHRRRRGLAHATLLAHALSARTGLPVSDCLERVGDPRPQVGRGRRERMGGPVGSIVIRGGALAPRRALVIDDVVTTGATMTACVRALRAGGAASVAGIAYARTTGR